jgi:hypothetical protein
VRRAAIVAGVVALAVPATASAIPTPDSLVAGGAAVAWLWGAAAAALGLAGATTRSHGRPAGALPGVATVALLFAVLALTSWLSSERAIERATPEFRCDSTYHVVRGHAVRSTEALEAAGTYRLRHPDEFAARAGEVGVDVVALDTRLPFWFASGHLAAPAAAVESRNVFAADLTQALRREAGRVPRGPRRLLLTTFRPDPLLELSWADRQEAVELLAAYDEIDHFVLDTSVRVDPASGTALVTGDRVNRVAGAPVPLATPGGADFWPVVSEGFLIDPSAVVFDGIDRLRSARRMARLLRRDDVLIVVPFARFYREPEVYLDEFAVNYLRGADPSRVIIVDYGDPQIAGVRAAAVEQLAGRDFVIVGYSKFDTMHYGLDLAWAAVQAGGRLLGYTADLPRVAATRAQWERSSAAAAPAWIVDPLVYAVAPRVRGRGDLWLALAGLGLAVSLALAPLTLLADRSRRLRRSHEAAIAEAPAASRGVLRATMHAAAVVGPPWLAPLAGLMTVAAGLVTVAVARSVAASFGSALIPAGAWVAWLGLALAVAVWLAPPRDLRGAWRAAAAVLLGGALAVIVGEWGAAACAAGTGLVGGRALVQIVAALLPAPKVGYSPGHLAGGTKGSRLVTLAQHPPPGVRVPATILLPSGAPPPGADVLLARLGPAPYIVRSSALDEDQDGASNAGRYLSLGPVDASAVGGAVAQVRASLPGGVGEVVVQRYLVHDAAAVVFTRDPQSPGWLLVEWSPGPASNLVGGHATDVRAYRLSRFTGTWTPTPPNARISAALDRVAHAAEHAAIGLDATADCEVLWSASSRLPVLVQARRVPSARPSSPQSRRYWEAELLEEALAVSAPGAEVRASALDAEVVLVEPEQVRVLRDVVAQDGAAADARARLGLPRVRGGVPAALAGRVVETSVESPWWQRIAEWRLERVLRRHGAARLERAQGALEAAAREALALAHRGDLCVADVRAVLRARVWPAVYHATILADRLACVPPPADGAPAGAAGVPPGLAMIRDAARLDARSFRARWGHRADRDWDVSCARYAWESTPLPSVPDDPDASAGEAGSSWLRAVGALRDQARDVGAIGVLALAEARRRAGEGSSSADPPPSRSAGEERVLAAARWTAVDLDEIFAPASTSFVTQPEAFSGVVWVPTEPGERPSGPGPVVLATRALEPRWCAALADARVVGWIAETGGVLAHAAIVARELGKPVLQRAEATALGGRRVRVDRAGRVDADPAVQGSTDGAGSAGISPGDGSLG